METALKNAYTEVNQILDLLGDEYKNKVPNKIINLMKQNQNNEYKTNINNATKIEDIKISRTASIIISILNLKYWAKPEEKEMLQKIYNENEKKFQEKINVYKNNDWLEKNRNNGNYAVPEEKSLVEVNKISIIAKIIRALKNIFRKK